MCSVSIIEWVSKGKQTKRKQESKQEEGSGGGEGEEREDRAPWLTTKDGSYFLILAQCLLKKQKFYSFILFLNLLYMICKVSPC